MATKPLHSEKNLGRRGDVIPDVLFLNFLQLLLIPFLAMDSCNPKELPPKSWTRNLLVVHRFHAMSLPIMACESRDTTRGGRDFYILLQPAATTAVLVESVQERSVCAIGDVVSIQSIFVVRCEKKGSNRYLFSSYVELVLPGKCQT